MSMQETPKIVAVTGASGYIGTRLLLQLETNLKVGKIVAFDRRPLPFPIHNISFHQVDASEPIGHLLRRHGVETLVHLASAYSHTGYFDGSRTSGRIWADESRQNDKMLEAVQESCQVAGVNHAIFLTSHSVYGAFADNPLPVTESSPIRYQPGDFLGQADYDADRSLQDFRESELAKEEGHRVKVTILRTCPILGYSDDHRRAEGLFPYRFLGAGDNPPFQFIHEIDMARLLEEVIQQEAEGIFNVAGEGVVFLRELAEVTRRKLTQLPMFLARPADWMFSKSGKTGSDNWNLHTTSYPIIMGTGKIKQALNYRFGYTSMEALNAFVNYNGL